MKYEAKKEDLSVGGALFGIGAIFAGVPVVMAVVAVAFLPLNIYGAWCDMHVWNWFVPAYFHLPLMPLWVSYGLGCWIRLQTTSTKVVKDEKTLFWSAISGSLIMHTATLGLAYLIHHFTA